MASGLVDIGLEPMAETLALLSPGVSHGFYGVSVNDKAYIDAYRSFEFSPLPIDHAANVITAMILAKEAEMPLPAEKRKFLVDDLGIPESVVARLEGENKEMADILKATGIEYKDAGGGEGTGDSGNSGGAVTGSGTGDGTPAAQPLTLDAIRSVVEEVVAPLKSDLDGVKAKQAEQEGGLNAAVEKVLGASGPGTPANGFVASKSNDTKVDPPSGGQDDDDWFLQSPLVRPDFPVTQQA
jgi:hypothetical protein